MKYFLIAGEPSGDMHGANLMRGILEADPMAEFRFWGGDKMAEVGGCENLGMHYRETSFMGFVQVALHIGKIMGQIRLCRRQIAEFRPDVVVLIDYAGFNLKIAQYAKSLGITTHYYIAPKVWAWNEKRVEKLRRWVDELFIIFPFEREYFAQKGIEVHFKGNPLVDALAMRQAAMGDRATFVAENGLDERPIIALLAGSRRSELRENIPIMQRIAESFEQYQFVVAGVDWIGHDVYDKYLINSSIRFVKGKTYELLHHSTAAVVTSGTATLETALIGVPQVVVYHIPWLHEVLRPLVLKIPYISLVNINLQRECVCEIVQSSTDATRAIESLRAILPDGQLRERMLVDYDELRTIIGESGASRRFAAKMVELLKKER
ncbi:MAG: lipid-A-disaccharide synthase [Rikenellaceae bacterium]